MDTTAAATSHGASPASRRGAVLAAVGVDACDRFDLAAIDVNGDTVALHYDLDGVGRLTETFTFTGHDVAAAAEQPAVRAALELLHLAASVSYIKALLPPQVDTSAWGLDPDRRSLLHDLLTHGLAEFGHVNGLALWDWFQLPDPVAPPPDATGEAPLPAGPLVPVGGGKDSIVTLEALRHLGPTLFGINPRGPIERTFDVAGMPIARVTRRLDERLFALNDAGAFNGHVPVTAIVSAAAVVAAILGGHDVVAMSNERSADQPTLVVDGRPVNHQWSKSSAFEEAFARLVAHQVHPDLVYVSFLRPASELAIARRFATLTRHHGTFNSCNRAFHLRGDTTDWCGQCPKCRFVFLVLAPFMQPEQLVAIVGSDLLDDPAQRDGFAVLAAVGGHKPFECVGEAEESAAALRCLASQPAWRDHAVVQALATEVGHGCDDLQRRAVAGEPTGFPPHLQEAFRAGV
jgi:UDP-N-acetyl-alpha-D-muramoyl-L-alanyl-L-glutamate epimerase